MCRKEGGEGIAVVVTFHTAVAAARRHRRRGHAAAATAAAAAAATVTATVAGTAAPSLWSLLLGERIQSTFDVVKLVGKIK